MTLKSAVFTPVLLLLLILNIADNEVRLNQNTLHFGLSWGIQEKLLLSVRLVLAVGAQHHAKTHLWAFGRSLWVLPE